MLNDLSYILLRNFRLGSGKQSYLETEPHKGDYILKVRRCSSGLFPMIFTKLPYNLAKILQQNEQDQSAARHIHLILYIQESYNFLSISRMV